MAAILCFNIGAFHALAGKPTIICVPDIVVSNDLGQCSAVVSFTVVGGGNPTPTLITCTTNISADEFPHDSGFAAVPFAAPFVSDICDPSVSFACSPPSGSAFPVGITPVTCGATDASGNTNSCTFNVRVIPYR